MFREIESVCFTRGTMIETETGLAPIEEIRVGDMVRTKDHGLKPVLWIGCREMSPQTLEQHPEMRPIRITAGALGPGYPARDLCVSPQHRILVKSRIAIRMFGEEEVLIAAKKLLGVAGIQPVEHAGAVEYYHMLFDRHEIVFANGAEAESLFTGPEALKNLSPEARDEILTIFPELRDLDYRAQLARSCPGGRRVAQAVARHVKNGKPLFDAASL